MVSSGDACIHFTLAQCPLTGNNESPDRESPFIIVIIRRRRVISKAQLMLSWETHLSPVANDDFHDFSDFHNSHYVDPQSVFFREEKCRETNSHDLRTLVLPGQLCLPLRDCRKPGQD